MKKSPAQDLYESSVKEQLNKKFGYKNPMMIPKLSKIIISMGLAKASQDKQVLNNCIEDLRLLSAQKPKQTKARKSISNFKLREGQTIGAVVTLRGHHMYDFLYRFNHISAPRIPDFRGLRRKADGRGNYSLGLKDQTIFSEIDLDKVKFSQGMNITFVTTANSDEECIELLTLMGLPLKKKN